MEYPKPAMTPESTASIEMSRVAASALPEVTPLSRRAIRVRPDEDRDFGVSEALRIRGGNAGLEVYVGWIPVPSVWRPGEV